MWALRTGRRALGIPDWGYCRPFRLLSTVKSFCRCDYAVKAGVDQGDIAGRVTAAISCGPAAALPLRYRPSIFLLGPGLAVVAMTNARGAASAVWMVFAAPCAVRQLLFFAVVAG